MTYSVNISNKADKKEIKRFYKAQHYSASLMGLDSCYLLKDIDQNIIAAVIVSYIKADNKQALLHGLVVDSKHRNRSLAKKLISYCLKQHRSIVCFSSPEISPLYLSMKMKQLPNESLNTSLLTPIIKAKFLTYQSIKKNLVIFINDN